MRQTARNTEVGEIRSQLVTKLPSRRASDRYRSRPLIRAQTMGEMEGGDVERTGYLSLSLAPDTLQDEGKGGGPIPPSCHELDTLEPRKK